MSLKKTLLVVLGAAALCVGARIVYRALTVTEEDRVRAVVDDTVAAAEKMSPGGIVAHIAPEYRDQHHGFNRGEMRAWLFQLFRRIDSLAVTVKKVEIAVDGRTAAATVVAAADASGPGGSGRADLFPGGGAGTFHLELEKRGRRWLITAARRPRLAIDF